MSKRRRRGQSMSNTVICKKCNRARDSGYLVHLSCNTCKDCGLPWMAPKPGDETCSCYLHRGALGGYSGGSTYKPCRHQWHNVRIGKRDIHATSHIEWASSSEWPTFGVYLDRSWKSTITKPVVSMPDIFCLGLPEAEAAAFETFKTQPPITSKDEPYFPAIVIAWPDHGAIPQPLAAATVNLVLKKMREGEKVEIGCLGAHGRTGTLVAMLLIQAERLSAEEAIKETR